MPTEEKKRYIYAGKPTRVPFYLLMEPLRCPFLNTDVCCSSIDYKTIVKKKAREWWGTSCQVRVDAIVSVVHFECKGRTPFCVLLWSKERKKKRLSFLSSAPFLYYKKWREKSEGVGMTVIVLPTCSNTHADNHFPY